MTPPYTFHYFSQAFTQAYTYLEQATRQKNKNEIQRAQETLGRLILLTEEFLPDNLWHPLIKETRFSIYLTIAPDLLSTLKYTYITSIIPQITH